MKLTSLKEKVVVITGASSGIGKQAVKSFLREGAYVILAARNLDDMRRHLKELGAGPSRALAIETDVSDPAQIEKLSKKAVEHFGRIDVWVNNAAISAYGLLEHLEPKEISRIIDINLKGQMFGSRVAIRLFKEQGYGNLINVSSVLGKGSAPLQSAYVAAKHGIVGFSSALREELLANPAHKKIDVSVVLPASMDTPLFKHAINRMGVEPAPIPPVYSPDVAVQALLRCAKHPEPEVMAGNYGKLMILFRTFMPVLFEAYMGKVSFRQQQAHRPEPSRREGKPFSTPSRNRPLRVGLLALLPVLALLYYGFVPRQKAA